MTSPALAVHRTPDGRGPQRLAAVHDIDHVVHDLIADGRIVHVERLPAREAITGVLAQPLPMTVATRLPEKLWSSGRGHRPAPGEAQRGHRYGDRLR